MHIYLSSCLINHLLGPETDKCEAINLPLTPDCQLIMHEYKYLQLDRNTNIYRWTGIQISTAGPEYKYLQLDRNTNIYRWTGIQISTAGPAKQKCTETIKSNTTFLLESTVNTQKIPLIFRRFT